MAVTDSGAVAILKRTYTAFQEDRASRLAAAFSFYAVFSIAPLLVIAVAVAGFVYGPQAAQGHVFDQLRQIVGPTAAAAIQAMVVSAHRPHAGMIATILGVGTLLFGAMGLFVQLQDALNTMWGVMPDPKGGIRELILNRILSFVMVAVLAAVLIASVAVTASISAFSKFVGGAHATHVAWLWQIVNTVVFLVVFALLFAAIYKILPDAEVSWHDVWMGAAITSILFTLGKYGIGLYLGRSGVSSAYGAAGSLVVLLLWVYYSAQILFAGAEFTRVYAQRSGTPVQPSRGAISLTALARAEQGMTDPPLTEAGKPQKPVAGEPQKPIAGAAAAKDVDKQGMARPGGAALKPQANAAPRTASELRTAARTARLSAANRREARIAGLVGAAVGVVVGLLRPVPHKERSGHRA